MESRYMAVGGALLWIVAAFSGCSRVEDPVSVGKNPDEIVKSLEYSDRAVESDLRSFARAMAATVQDGEVLDLLRYKISERFDGQTETLYEHVADETFSDGMSLGKRLCARSGLEKSSSIEMAALVSRLESVMNLQFFMPWFDEWDGKTVPLVAYLPQTVDDNEIKEFRAFDLNGKEIVIPLAKANEYQYIMVGRNERTDAKGKLFSDLILTSGFKNGICESKSLIPKQASTGHLDGAWEVLYQMQIWQDHEPFGTNGDPEISIQLKSLEKPYDIGTKNFDHRFDGTGSIFNHKDDTSLNTIDMNLFSWWLQTYGCIFSCLIYERDGDGTGQSVSFTVPFVNLFGLSKSSTVTFKIANSDDKLGMFVVHFNDTQMFKYQTGDADAYFIWR